jgi:FkbM family methyltransferase
MLIKTANKILLARLIYLPLIFIRKIFGKSSIVKVKRGDINWILDLSEGIDFSIFLLGSFEPGTKIEIVNNVSKGDVVLDIGANIGAHTLFLAKKVGENGIVIAIEPTDWAINKLKANIDQNPSIKNINVQHVFLSDGVTDKVRPKKVYSSWPLNRSSLELHDGHRGALMEIDDAEINTLDKLVEDLDLKTISVIKIDVDGNELSVFNGGINTIKKFKPTIFMEMSPYQFRDDKLFIDLVAYIKNIDYEIYTIDSKSKLPLDPLQLKEIIPAGFSINVIAKPLLSR